jgi:hypothetical protein
MSTVIVRGQQPPHIHVPDSAHRVAPHSSKAEQGTKIDAGELVSVTAWCSARHKANDVNLRVESIVRRTRGFGKRPTAQGAHGPVVTALMSVSSVFTIELALQPSRSAPPPPPAGGFLDRGFVNAHVDM